MKVNTISTTQYETCSPDTPVSKLVSQFDDPNVTGIVVLDDGEYEGVITRRQLAASHRQPKQKAKSLVWNVSRLDPHSGVRDAARLMIQGQTRLLPVFEGDNLVGVVTADDLLAAVQEFLDAATVEDVVSTDLVTVDPESTFGEAIHVLREEGFTHLPVVEDDEAVGILSLFDVTDVAARSVERSQGGDAGGTDSFGGDISDSAGRSRRGGFGAREGESDRLLDLPVRDVMVSPVRTITPEASLEEAVEQMFDNECSSLVVTTNGNPFGIVTKTDVLEALTWEAEGSRAVQVYGTDLLDDMTYADVVDNVESLASRTDGNDLRVQDAKVHLHEHDEKRRGVPLLMARLRLYTDRGYFVATGEGYGATEAIDDALDVMERQLRDAKTHGQTKKPPGEEFWEKRFGWWLEGER